jgi:hypothetical protein
MKILNHQCVFQRGGHGLISAHIAKFSNVLRLLARRVFTRPNFMDI